MHLVQINYAFDPDLADPEALIERYTTLTGWSEALLAAGAGPVTVVQRFGRNATLTRNGIDYIFRNDGGGPRPGMWSWPGQLHREAASRKPDIAHVNGLIFPAQTWELRRFLPERSAIVVQDHASRPPEDGARSGVSLLRQALRRRVFRAADAFLFATTEHLDAWRRAGFIGPHQSGYQVMEASTELRPMPRAAARHDSGVDGNPALLWVGRLNDNKDPLTVLDGLERALEHAPDARLTMVYSAGDLLPAVNQRLRASPALASRVRLVGRVPCHRMPAFYGAADVFVLGSHHEGSGYALMEALASSLAPVVTDIPTFRLLTAGGTLGALWTPGDASACARALVDVAARDLAAGRARIAAHFARELSWAAVGRQAMAAYRDVVSRRRARLRPERGAGGKPAKRAADPSTRSGSPRALSRGERERAGVGPRAWKPKFPASAERRWSG